MVSFIPKNYNQQQVFWLTWEVTAKLPKSSIGVAVKAFHHVLLCLEGPLKQTKVISVVFSTYQRPPQLYIVIW